MPDESVRRYGQVEITVRAEPIIGDPPAWANAIEIANEAIAIVKRRHDEKIKAEAEPLDD
jgi:hypothetical protein